LEGRFGGASKMEGHLEALLEMDFCTKPPNFGVEAHMEAPTGDALKERFLTSANTKNDIQYGVL
jgi:hypothetical protein